MTSHILPPHTRLADVLEDSSEDQTCRRVSVLKQHVFTNNTLVEAAAGGQGNTIDFRQVLL
jgi:hypothetical protein